MPRLAAVATAVPPHRLRQSDAKRWAEALFVAESPDLARILSVFDHAGVETRYLARPVEWYFARHGWKDRNEAFVDAGLDLLETAAHGALDRASLSAEEIDGIVLVTSTGLSTPSLEARLANRMKLRPDTLRVPLWGLGCGGGVAGLARTADLAAARPRGRFLLLSLELCSLAFLRGRLDKKLLVAGSLFGDGCAAAVMEGDAVADASHPAWVRSASHQWPETEHVMGWKILDEGLDVVFDPIIPAFVRDHIREPVERFVDGARIDHYAFHPGGAKVLEAFEAALDLSTSSLAESRDVLRDYGNMSSPTFLFVLERILASADRAGPILASALGPGFSCEIALLDGSGP